MTYKFNWSDYKSVNGSQHVWFPGGFSLYVVPHKVSIAGHWRVTWYIKSEEVPANEMPGLTDQLFESKVDAKKAAEEIFWPIMKIVTGLVRFKVEPDMDSTPWRRTP